MSIDPTVLASMIGIASAAVGSAVGGVVILRIDAHRRADERARRFEDARRTVLARFLLDVEDHWQQVANQVAARSEYLEGRASAASIPPVSPTTSIRAARAEIELLMPGLAPTAQALYRNLIALDGFVFRGDRPDELFPIDAWREALARLHDTREVYVKAAHAELGLIFEE
ncbi:MAG: hypothetical protein ACYDCI_03190 [Candidatus Limnocylindrales bacterium]